MKSCIIWCKKKNSDFFWKKDFTVALRVSTEGENLVNDLYKSENYCFHKIKGKRKNKLHCSECSENQF